MSSSNPPKSPIVAKLRQSSAGPTGEARPSPTKRSFRHRLTIKFAAVMRWLHIYLSMIGLATILFFSVTGITLNHPDWFTFLPSDRSKDGSGEVQTAWLNLPDDQVEKFAIVEHLRKAHGIHGEVADVRIDDRECMVSFKGPGYSADVFIVRGTGKYTLKENFFGLIAVINDLHKGRDTGPVWSAVIDVSAIVMTVVSLTGLVLLFYIKRRRISGTLVVVVGTIVMGALYWWGIP